LLDGVDESNVGDYITVEQNGDAATISIDRDGSGTAYESTALLEIHNLENVVDLETLLNDNQVIY